VKGPRAGLDRLAVGAPPAEHPRERAMPLSGFTARCVDNVALFFSKQCTSCKVQRPANTLMEPSSQASARRPAVPPRAREASRTACHAAAARDEAQTFPIGIVSSGCGRPRAAALMSPSCDATRIPRQHHASVARKTACADSMRRRAAMRRMGTHIAEDDEQAEVEDAQDCVARRASVVRHLRGAQAA